jgi:hypothetical protein
MKDVNYINWVFRFQQIHLFRVMTLLLEKSSQIPLVSMHFGRQVSSGKYSYLRNILKHPRPKENPGLIDTFLLFDFINYSLVTIEW